jgi:hypothetical protein
MVDAPSEKPVDARPRVIASLVEPDPSATPLLLAVGHAIVAAAGLEKALQLELTRLLIERNTHNPDTALSTISQDLSRLDNLTAGQLLRELRTLDLPPDLVERISDAIDRRNRLVHHTYEDPQLAKAVADGDGMDVVAKRVERLALDCAELAVELQLVAVPRLEALLGTSRADMIEMVRSIDASTLVDPRERDQLLTIQALANLDGIAAVLDDLDQGDLSHS